jgi:hypothetical protein
VANQRDGPIRYRSTPSYLNSNLPTPPARMHPTSRWSSMQWTCFIAVGSTDFVWFLRTVIRLTARIREQGVDVFGFGEHKTPESFRQACRRFVYTENLLAGAANSQNATSTSKPLRPPGAAAPIIKKVITQMESEDGWVLLGEVGRQLANLASDFDPRTFGFRKLSDLVRRTNSFEIEHPKGAPCVFARPLLEHLRSRPPKLRLKKQRRASARDIA